MNLVFVSHASADAALLDHFVNTLLVTGLKLSEGEIFYSSAEDMGVLGGKDLMATLRDEVGTATVVIALITPVYRTRPICIAELGAAWVRGDALLPISVPTLTHDSLDGVLEGMMVRSIDDPLALDELHDRVRAATGPRGGAASWTRAKRLWLDAVPRLVAGLETPSDVSPETVAQLTRERDEAYAELDGLEAENARLKRALDAKLQSLADATELLLPEEDLERFEALVSNARDAMHNFQPVLVEAIWETQFGDGGLARASWGGDPSRETRIDALETEGLLSESTSGLLEANSESRRVRKARDTVKRLQDFLTHESGEDFDAWFAEEYDFDTPSLAYRAVWDALF